ARRDGEGVPRAGGSLPNPAEPEPYPETSGCCQGKGQKPKGKRQKFRIRIPDFCPLDFATATASTLDPPLISRRSVFVAGVAPPDADPFPPPFPPPGSPSAARSSGIAVSRGSSHPSPSSAAVRACLRYLFSSLLVVCRLRMA